MKRLAVTPDSPSHVVFAVNVRALREGRGWTQLDLGVLAGFPADQANRVSKVERAAKGTTLGTVDRFAAALGVSAASLLERPAEGGGS